MMRHCTKASLHLPLIILRRGEPMRQDRRATHLSVTTRFVLAPVAALLLALPCCAQRRSASSTPEKERGVLLEQLSWDEAEHTLTPDRIVVIPLGAESKEHGRHLQLNNDWVMAEYLKERVLGAAPVVIAPTINYSYYPAFLEYPGSTSLGKETARDMILDICHSLASHGPRRFYILNTGISTIRPLSEAVKALASEGVTLRYFNWDEIDAVVKKVQQQAGGTHADEIETSMMLYIAPNTVRMSKAAKDLSPDRPGPLTRNPKATSGTYSPTGAWGDPTLATKEKGQILVEATVRAILGDIEDLQKVH
jgi:creatinine amidohydrolase